MSGFSPEWLALREPADHGSVNAALRAACARAMAGRDPVRVVDLGSGAGSNLRGLAPALGARQHWTLVDYDQRLLDVARSREADVRRSGLQIRYRRADLSGGDFAAIAKESSADTSSATDGGKLTISRGQTVPEFDKVAFELKQGVVSRPVKTTYGYHLIEALSPVRKAKITPIDEVRATIRAQLRQQKRTEVMTKWIEDLRSEYEGKVSYAEGFAPPELPEADTTTSDPANQ